MLSQATADTLGGRSPLDPLPPAHLKGRDATVHSYRLLNEGA